MPQWRLRVGRRSDRREPSSSCASSTGPNEDLRLTVLVDSPGFDAEVVEQRTQARSEFVGRSRAEHCGRVEH